MSISTVFLGIDHNYSNAGPPVLWETMIFGGPPALDQYQARCSGTFADAQEMHNKTVEMAKAELVKSPEELKKSKWKRKLRLE